MKTIRTRIMLGILLPVILIAVILGVVSAYLNFDSTFTTLKQTLAESVAIASGEVSQSLLGYKNLAVEFGQNRTLSGEADKEEKITELNRLAKIHGFISIELVDTNGISLTDNADYSKMDSFTQVKSSGKPFVSDPISKNGSLIIYISAPVIKNGVMNGVVAIAADGAFLSEIIANIKVGSGNAAVLNRRGDTIGYADIQLVHDRYNTQKEAQSDDSLTRLAEIEAAMCRGETGTGEYAYGGQEKLMAYQAIPDTNGWSIDIAIVRSEFMTGTQNSLIITLILVILAVLISILVARNTAGLIATPVKLCAQRLELLAKGDLQTQVPTIQNKDETGQLAESTKKLVKYFQDVITDIHYSLGEISRNNLTVTSQAMYQGDFFPIHTAIENITNSLNKTLLDIDISADQVSVASKQVSNGALALSEGVADQASTIEELAATIGEISEQVRINAESAKQASEKASITGREMMQSNQQMQEMMKAMEDINNQSSEIGLIIKTIEGIAFQTNILAINAAIEAARAGEAGKSFAVVADQVQDLASKSAKASKSTAVLIESSLKVIQAGAQIADNTAKSLLFAVDGAKGVTDTIDTISKASLEQANSIELVTQGIDAIANVVQTNSSTAEESAIASAEMTSQAQVLRKLVGEFKLRR